MTENGYLESLAAFGMRLGLERITLLLEELGSPQERLDAIHVVGTTGSPRPSAAAAALTASGLRAGAYLSPHVIGWDERVQIGGRPVGAAALAVALDRVQEAARAVERSLGEGPTQFEALTAAAFLILAEAGVEACVVEAGLGGRHDATRVVDARVVGLTNVGLDHQRVLGETREAILAEKLAVLEPGAALCVGVGMDDEAGAEAAALAAGGGRVFERTRSGAGRRLPLAGGYLRDDAALALRLAELLLALAPLARDRGRGRAAAAWFRPGAPELIRGRPAIRRTARTTRRASGAGRRARCRARGPAPARRRIALQDDKPLAAPCSDARTCSGCARGHDQRARGPCPSSARRRDRRRGARRRARPTSSPRPDPPAAPARARERAGAGGAVIVTGSLYLLERVRATALEAR